MEANEFFDVLHQVEGEAWMDRFVGLQDKNLLSRWVSSFHPENAPCRYDRPWNDGRSSHYSVNFGAKFIFYDDTAWMVRFPFAGKVLGDDAEEKLAMEVAAMRYIRAKTDIPVAKILFWGRRCDNELSLGPFMITEFIEGVPLALILQGPPFDEIIIRPMREDLEDDSIETMYREMANIMIKLFRLEFNEIGTLANPISTIGHSSTRPPLTFKSNAIVQRGGLDSSQKRGQGFLSTTQYLHWLLEEEFDQLFHRPNSTSDTKSRYSTLKVLQSMISDCINPQYNRGKGKFRLICDNFGPSNLVVKGREDLTVVGVTDLGFCYTGPAQMFASAPWWILNLHPCDPAFNYVDGEPPDLGARFLRHLDIFMEILMQEETSTPGNNDRKLSDLVKWSIDSGAMWLHMLLSYGFDDESNFPLTQLRQNAGFEEWKEREDQLLVKKEIDELMRRQVIDLIKYNKALEKMHTNKQLLEKGEITKATFIGACYGFESESVSDISNKLSKVKLLETIEEE